MFSITLYVVDRSTKIFGNITAKEICNKKHFKFYIYAWYLIVTQSESTSSTATVAINITQQNTTLKLVTTQFEMNARQSTVKDDQIRCSKCRPLAFTQAHHE